MRVPRVFTNENAQSSAKNMAKQQISERGYMLLNFRNLCTIVDEGRHRLLLLWLDTLIPISFRHLTYHYVPIGKYLFSPSNGVLVTEIITSCHNNNSQFFVTAIQYRKLNSAIFSRTFPRSDLDQSDRIRCTGLATILDVCLHNTDQSYRLNWYNWLTAEYNWFVTTKFGRIISEYYLYTFSL